MDLDGGRSIGMPKSSSERSSKSEFSDSEYVFGTVKFNGGIDMGDGGGERDGDLGGDGNVGAREGGVRGGGEGDLGGDGNLVGGDCDVEGCEEGDVGVGIFAYFAKHGELWERVEGELVLQGNPKVVERGIWGVGIFAYFAKQGELWESGGGIGITGEPARCSVSVFFS